jgi:hypothetical protein
MISPIVIVLLIVYGSHISDWLPSSSKHHIHAHPAAGHVIVIFSLFILGQSNEPDRPLVGQGLIVLACWILILMFTRTGKYASITALALMVSHQVTVRLIAQKEKKADDIETPRGSPVVVKVDETTRQPSTITTKRLQTVEFCLKAILVVVLVCSFSFEYTKVWRHTGVLSFLFGKRRTKKM